MKKATLITKELMSILACPICKGDLKLTDFRGKARKKGERGFDGKLTCKSCNESYPIKEGIPILLPPNLRE